MTDLFIQRDADFSEDGQLRHVLRRTIGPGKCVMWIGGNPSDAGKDREDMTSLRINHFTRAWGYGSNVVVNPIPKISSTPREAWDWANRRGRDPQVMADLAHNLAIIEREAAACAMHVACWGNLMGAFPDVLAAVILAVKKPLYCLGINSDGSPRHPMSRGKNRVPDHQQPILWKAT